MTDSAAIVRVKEGNIDAFEIIVQRYAGKIRVFVAARLFDKAETDDIVQTSFIQFYKAIPRFDAARPIYPYLLQIARNELNMFFRKRNTTVSLDENVSAGTLGVLVQEEPIEDILAGLKADHKKALSWFAQGYSYKEIARKLGKPLNTVRTLIRRARLHVQKNTSL